MVMMSHFQHCAIYVSMARGTSVRNGLKWSNYYAIKKCILQYINSFFKTSMLILTFYLICKNPSTKEGIKQDNCKLAIWPVKPPHHPDMTSDPRVKNFRNLPRDLLHQRICTCNCPVVYKVFEEAIHFMNTWSLSWQ